MIFNHRIPRGSAQGLFIFMGVGFLSWFDHTVRRSSKSILAVPSGFRISDHHAGVITLFYQVRFQFLVHFTFPEIVEFLRVPFHIIQLAILQVMAIDDLKSPSHVRLKDMWGFAERQETLGISPEMFREFIFPYQNGILERFGLNCCGCCEPLESLPDLLIYLEGTEFGFFYFPWLHCQSNR